MDDRHVPAAPPPSETGGHDQLNAELVGLLADLRVSVTNYVSRRRAQGASVERVLPEVRCLVREAESCERWLDPEDTLVSQAERWSLEAYRAD